MDHRTPPPGLVGAAVLPWYRRELGRDFGAYFLVHGTLALATLLVLPILVRHLSGKQLGFFGLVEASFVLATTASLLGLKFAYLQWVADRTPQERGPVLATVLLLTFGAGLVAGSLLGILFGSELALTGLGVGIEERVPPWVLVLLVVSANLNTTLSTDLRALRRPGLLVIVSGVQLAATLASTYVMVAQASLGVTGAIAGQAAGYVLASAVLWLMLCGGVRLRVDLSLVRPMLGYGLPVMSGLFIRYGLDWTVRWVLALLVALEAAGDYLLAVKVAGVFEAVLAKPFWMAWGGHVYHLVKRGDATLILGRVVEHVALIGIVFAVALLLAADIVFAAVGAADRPLSAALLPLVLAGYLVLLLKSPLSAGLLSTRRMTWHVRYSLLSLLVFALAGPLGALVYGAHGVVLAWLAAETAAAIAVARASSAIIPVGFAARREAALVLGGAVLGIATYVLMHTSAFFTARPTLPL